MSGRRVPRALWMALALGLASACGPRVVEVEVVPEPVEGEVFFDGASLGAGPAVVRIDPRDTEQHTVRVCGGPGWFCRDHQIVAVRPTRMHIEATPDLAWRESVEAPGMVNVTVTLPADPARLDDVWSAITMSIERAGAPFEVLDARAYYLRTAWETLGADDAELRLRTRVTVAFDGVADGAPRFDVTIESEQIDPQGRTKALVPRTIPGFIEALAAVGLTRGAQ